MAEETVKNQEEKFKEIILENWRDKMLSAHENGQETAILYIGDMHTEHDLQDCFRIECIRKLEKELAEIVNPSCQLKISGYTAYEYTHYQNIQVEIMWGSTVERMCSIL